MHPRPTPPIFVEASQSPVSPHPFGERASAADPRNSHGPRSPERAIIRFAALAFGLTWPFWWGAALVEQAALSLPFSSDPLLMIGGFGPSLAGLLLARRAAGGAGVRPLLRRAMRWRAAPGWYAGPLSSARSRCRPPPSAARSGPGGPALARHLRECHSDRAGVRAGGRGVWLAGYVVAVAPAMIHGPRGESSDGRGVDALTPVAVLQPHAQLWVYSRRSRHREHARNRRTVHVAV